MLIHEIFFTFLSILRSIFFNRSLLKPEILNILYNFVIITTIMQLSVIIDTPGEEQYHFQPRLFGKV